MNFLRLGRHTLHQSMNSFIELKRQSTYTVYCKTIDTFSAWRRGDRWCDRKSSRELLPIGRSQPLYLCSLQGTPKCASLACVVFHFLITVPPLSRQRRNRLDIRWMYGSRSQGPSCCHSAWMSSSSSSTFLGLRSSTRRLRTAQRFLLVQGLAS